MIFAFFLRICRQDHLKSCGQFPILQRQKFTKQFGHSDSCPNASCVCLAFSPRGPSIPVESAASINGEINFQRPDEFAVAATTSNDGCMLELEIFENIVAMRKGTYHALGV